MADDELFEDLGDFNDLDETPDFSLGGEEELPFDVTGDEGGGISRTFKIVFGLMAMAVVAIVLLLLFFALNGGSKLTPNEKTSTAVVATNVAMENSFNATLTALAIIDAATQTAVFNHEMTATQDEFLRQTQVSIDATNAAGTVTAQFILQQTLDAQLTATQHAVDLTATAVQEANKVTGLVIDQQGNIFGGVTLRLYKDDGDGQFDPKVDLTVPTPIPTAISGTGGSGAGQSIGYGQSVQGTLAISETALWSFTGATSDVVTIDAIAGDPVQMDMFVELLGPDNNVLTGDDDSGDASNARIANFTLRQAGAYTIRVSSVSGAGDYTLTLAKGTGSTTRQNTGIVLVNAARGPQPVALAQGSTPVPTGDELIDQVITATNGKFDFGSLEPGIYWIELDYDSLPPDLKALVPAGKPLVVKVTVPAGGEVTFEIGAPTPVPTETPGIPTLSPIDQTASARPQATAGSPQPTTSGVPNVVVTLTMTQEPIIPTTGFFSDIGDSAGGIEGSSGLTVLAIAAVGLVAVVFIARKLRTSA